MQPTVYVPAPARRAAPQCDDRELLALEQAVGDALLDAAAHRDFTNPVLRATVATLGSAARAHEVPADELLARLEALVRVTLMAALAPSAADVVFVYLWRFARHALERPAAPWHEREVARVVGGP